MNQHLLEVGLLSFVSLFTMVNPLSIIPVYISMTSDLASEKSRSVAIRATLTALLLLLLFALTGQFIFKLFAISVNSLRVVGGILFLIIGYEMLQARLTRTKRDDQDNTDPASDVSITPLGIPLICGPGAITTVVILMNESHTLPDKLMVLLATASVMALTLACLLSGRRITRALGDNGNKVMMRLMGLIVMMIAVEFFFSGLKPIVRDILNIQG
jgi:multiple antibiotic resistance protein